MKTRIAVVRQVVRASSADRRRGLLAFVVLEIDQLLRIEGVTVRRTKRGDLTLSFPERIDAHGVRHAIVAPRNCTARHHIEHAVFQQLRHLAPTLATEES